MKRNSNDEAVKTAAAKRRRLVEQAGSYDAARATAAAEAVAENMGGRPNRAPAGRTLKDVEKAIRAERSGDQLIQRRTARTSTARASVDSVAARLDGGDRIHDIMAGPPPGGVPLLDPLLLIRTLGSALDALGLEGAWQRPRELIAKSEQMSADAVALRNQAAQRYHDAGVQLARGEMPLSEFAAVVGDVALWLENDISSGRASMAMREVDRAAQAMRSNAVGLAHQEAPVLYQRLQPLAADAVAVIASGPAIPPAVFNASNAARAAVAEGHDFAHWWVTAQAAASRFEEVHRVAGVLREQLSGALGALVVWPEYCASWAGPIYRNWRDAMEADAGELRKSTPSLVCWIRLAHDRGWRPGLWLAQDLVAEPAKPGLLQRITGGGG